MSLNSRVSPRSMLNSKYEFKPFSELKSFIKRKRGFDKKVFTLQDLLLELKFIISQEKLFDEKNVSIIVCSQELEEALNVKALHVSQFRNQILTQLVMVNEDDSTPQWQCWERGRGQKTRPIKGAARRCIYEANISVNRVVNSDCRFSCKEKLLLLIRTLPEIDKNQTVFSYKEIAALVSRYIITHKQRLFDRRNVRVCIVTNDPLGAIFELNYFHRCQFPNLLMKQLIPVTKNDQPTDTVEVSSGSSSNTPGVGCRVVIQSKEINN